MEFRITLAGAICVVIVTLLDWMKVGGVGYNLFGLWRMSFDSHWLETNFWEITPIRTYLTVLSVLLILSYIIILASLIRSKSKKRAVLTYTGFGLAVFVAAAFNIIIVLDYIKLAGMELTLFSLLTFVIAVFAGSLTHRLPKNLGETVRILTRLFMYVSYAALLALLILTVVDVVRRLIFGVALTGVTEYSQMFLIVALCAMAHSIIEGKFIIVNTLVEKFPKWLNITFEIVMGATSLAFFAVVGWQLVLQVESSKLFREAYFMVNVPRWPMYAVLGAALLACALATVVFVYERIVNYKDPKQKNALDDPEIAHLTVDVKQDNVTDEGGAS